MEPSKFVINPEKGTKFTIKTNSKYKQDVIVMCDSYLFEIKNPRARNGMESQIFHRLVKGETITFEIGLRLPSDRPTAYISASPPTCASGTLEIYHYRTTCQENDDSDEKWRIKEKNQFINGQIYSCQRYGRWVEYLHPEYETEDVKKRKAEFLIENFKYYEYNSWLEISEKTEKVMMTTVAPNDPEEKTDREAEENLKKGLKYFVDLHREEERKKKELEEKKVEKKDVETVQTVQPAEKQKKKKKKCVIM
ncbi:hypothetical protein CAEBREN_01560 [Caenorhabditis brenneri]|uniref:Uncharacterized protein n=1 Tax=Caenorhabditis brenneri TaxID=135651 RepID=G0P889_CAEBE|nr:hypothetical protein CAEBREN_01560 [Caenorhabditis brenneri]